MSVPSGLNVKTNINEMTIGDCIPCRYTSLTSGTPGNFSELGTSTASEIPVTGFVIPDGTFYFIMVEPTLLIADRVVQINVSWNALNNAKFIEGKIIILNNTEYLIRSLSGGCTYVDENGNMSLTDKSLGAWPVNNEWDKYIVNSDLGGKITPGDDNVWHFNILNNLGKQSWTKDTSMTGVSFPSTTGTALNKIIRPTLSNSPITVNAYSSTSAIANIGFRPVLQLKHSKQTNLWY